MSITIETLKSIQIFSSLPEEHLTNLLPICSEMCIEKIETIIFKDGDPGDALFIILSGLVEIVKPVENQAGSSKSLAKLPSGTFFGEMALLTGEPRSATAIAHSTNLQMIKILRPEFLNLMAKYPDLAAKILGALFSVISERLRSANLEVVTLYETGRIISSTRNPSEVSKKVLDRMVCTLNAQQGRVFLWNEYIDCFECSASFPENIEFFPLTINTPAALFFQELGEALLINEPFKESATIDEVCLNGFKSGSILISPLVDQKKTAGVILLAHSQPGFFKLPNLTLLQGVSGQVSQALLSGRLLQENESRRRYNQVYVRADL
ncbi:MAG: cyclic nucleotide-binding domain-containing protein [Candidatus Riflebacteria bacterium]|nr:cyclic nucleotide-binding domain-containing protein [Candidatus Riflebacteria bacterium]